MKIAPHRVVVADSCQLLVGGAHCRVAARRIACPGEGAAVVGVVRACHAHFVAVVDGGRAGHRELHYIGQSQQLLAFRQVGKVEFAVLAVVLAGREAPEDTLGVVAVHKVHRCVVSGVRVVLAQRAHLTREKGRRFVALAVVREALVVHRAEEAEDSVAEAVAHSRVSLVAVDHRQHIAFLPELTDDRCGRVGALDGCAELLPVVGRERGVVHHVETPAVRAWV